MADDELIDDDEDFEEEELEGDLDEEALGEDDELEDEDAVLDESDDLDADEPTEEAVVAPEEEPATPRARKKRDEEEDDDDEVDPDDVEADLDTILKDRIAASEDEEDEEELEEAPRTTGEVVDGVQPKKANEFMCTGCFLLVNPGQFGPPGAMECPVGESVCPAIDQLTAQYQKAQK